ncbi:MAG: hypothetical protein ACYC4J_12555, partial [Gemmatimonadaceae bacterium]
MPPLSPARLGVLLLAAPVALLSAQGAGKRPMTWLDAQFMKSASAPAISPDGRWALYTVSTPDWKEAKSQTDIFVVSTAQGLPSTKQLTFTKEKNEAQPRWTKDGQWFLFASNREAPAAQQQLNQLYLMRPDGGEARRITDAKEGVSTFNLSKDGKWLVYRSGKSDEEQLYALAVADLVGGRPLDSLKATQLTKHPAGVGQWRFAPDSRRIYFITADTVDRDEKARTEKKFTVKVRNAEAPVSSLWALDLDTKKATRLTTDTTMAVSSFSVSDDGRWIGYVAVPNDRYKRNVTEEGIYGDLFLLDTQGNAIERLTNNAEIGERGPSFSPDSRWVAFSASDDMSAYNMKNHRVYLRAVDARGGDWRK